jgi:putative membrane protein
MKTVITILLILVALEHLYFLYLEMFLWTTKKSIKIFGLESKEFALKTKVLAANQGLYNGFLAAGLFWSLFIDNEVFSNAVAIFFLTCITIAGIYGAYSTKKIRLFYIQSIPAIAIFTLLLLYF